LTLAGKNKIIGELKTLILEAADPAQQGLMIAHFCEKLGVSPGYFRTGPAVAEIKLPMEVAGGATRGLATLPKQFRDLVNFLVMFPEFLGELKGAGLDEIVQDSAAVRIIKLLEQVAEDKAGQPEQLLSAPLDVQERAYIVKLLTDNPPFGHDEKHDYARGMCHSLIGWMQSILQKRNGADLQQQIQEAERLGNTGLVMELMRQKQEAGKKRMGF
jgi:DNA primase